MQHGRIVGGGDGREETSSRGSGLRLETCIATKLTELKNEPLGGKEGRSEGCTNGRGST